MKNKFLKGVVTFGVASAICMAMGITASAASVKEKGTINIDASTQTLTVTETSASVTTGSAIQASASVTTGSAIQASTDREILFGVVSVNKDKKVKTPSWEVYPMVDGKVTIDLSSLNTQKDNYIQLKGDINDDVVTFKLPKTDKTVKLVYDADNGIVKEKNNKEVSLQYRTQYGSWKPYSTSDDLRLYEQRGATLYFRLTPTAGTGTEALADDVTASIDTTLPGKEIKVKIAKKANAPKATVSYTKNTITLPRNVKYRAISDAEPTIPDWKKNGTTVVVTSAKTAVEGDEYSTLLAGGALEMSTVKSGKPDSKIGHYDFNAQSALVGYAEAETEAGAKVADSVIKAKVSENAEETTKVVSATLKDTTKKNVTTYNLEIKNSTDDKYEVVYDSASAPSATTKVKSIKSGATLTLKKVEEGKLVWIRRAGDQKNAKWATPWVTMGKVVLPKADDNPGNSGDDEQGGNQGTQLSVEDMLKEIEKDYFETELTAASDATGKSTTVKYTTKDLPSSTEKFIIKDGKVEVDGVTVEIALVDASGNYVVDADEGTTATRTFFTIADGVVTYNLSGTSYTSAKYEETKNAEGNSVQPAIKVTLKKGDTTHEFSILIKAHS